MQDYNTIIGAIQMRLNGCQTRSVMDRYKIGSGTLFRMIFLFRFPKFSFPLFYIYTFHKPLPFVSSHFMYNCNIRPYTPKKAAGATRRQFCNSSIAMNSKQQLTK